MPYDKAVYEMYDMIESLTYEWLCNQQNNRNVKWSSFVDWLV